MSSVVTRPGLHLDWQAADPRAVAGRLAAVLGRAVVPGERVWLSGGSLRVMPSPGAVDDRLVGLRVGEREAATLADPPPAPRPNAPRPRLVAVGWATVETDRAATEVGALFRSATGADPSMSLLPDDRHLGARACAVWLGAGGPAILLLEPTTEGLLAAALARFGEGPAVLYLGAPTGSLAGVAERLRAAGVVPTRGPAGPFGRQVLVRGARPWGPHLVVAESGYHRAHERRAPDHRP